jgi:hypothetical protein
VVGVLGLDQHLARPFGAAGTTGDLHQLREQALGRTPVGGKQRRVGSHGANQRELREIMAFGQHLGADQNVGFAVLNRLHHRLPLLAAACRIAVDAQDAGLREALGKTTSIRCVPRPKAPRSWLPQVGQVFGTRAS